MDVSAERPATFDSLVQEHVAKLLAETPLLDDDRWAHVVLVLQAERDDRQAREAAAAQEAHVREQRRLVRQALRKQREGLHLTREEARALLQRDVAARQH